MFLDNYLLIENNFLDNMDINKLSKILENIYQYKNKNKNQNNFLENDKKKYILFDIKDKNQNINSHITLQIYDIIYNNPKLKRIIKTQFNVDLKYPTYDIEYRIYKHNPKSMGWHQDHKIINKNYLECIYVIENTTNSLFRWYKDFKFHDYLQKNNDLIILQPNDLIHNIDPILYGEKRILKFIIDLE
jgi:hypothetical protein